MQVDEHVEMSSVEDSCGIFTERFQ